MDSIKKLEVDSTKKKQLISIGSCFKDSSSKGLNIA